jgi:ribose transport system substrate-binding protein
MAVPLVMFGGCGTSRHSPDEKYFLIATNIKLPYWQTAQVGLARAGSSMKVRTELAGPDTYDTNAQHQEFLRVLTMKPTGILVSAGDSKLIQPDIDAAMAQGVLVITVDSDVEDSGRLLFIGTDNYKAGTQGGELVARELHGSGNVVVYTMPSQANLYQRLHGYQDVFAAHPRIKVTQIIDIKGDPRIAFDSTRAILENGSGKVDAFVCLEAIACPEVADVLDRQHVLHKLVVAMDTDPRTLDWIRRGGILATIGQKPYTMAYYGVKMLDDLHHDKIGPLNIRWDRAPFSPIPAFVDTGLTLIDKSNVDSFVKQLESQTKGS